MRVIGVILAVSLSLLAGCAELPSVEAGTTGRSRTGFYSGGGLGVGF